MPSLFSNEKEQPSKDCVTRYERRSKRLKTSVGGAYSRTSSQGNFVVYSNKTIINFLFNNLS